MGQAQNIPFWPKDREHIRERYRRLARIKLGAEGDTQ